MINDYISVVFPGNFSSLIAFYFLYETQSYIWMDAISFRKSFRFHSEIAFNYNSIIYDYNSNSETHYVFKMYRFFIPRQYILYAYRLKTIVNINLSRSDPENASSVIFAFIANNKRMHSSTAFIYFFNNNTRKALRRQMIRKPFIVAVMILLYYTHFFSFNVHMYNPSMLLLFFPTRIDIALCAVLFWRGRWVKSSGYYYCLPQCLNCWFPRIRHPQIPPWYFFALCECFGNS